MDFKGGASFWNDVLFSIKNNRFKGSTLIILSSILIPLVEENGVIIPKMVQYLIFKLSSIVNVGIMCINSHKKTTRHARFWQTLINVALPEAKWIVGGNFNNVESIKNHSQGYFGSTMGGREFNEWNAFMANLGLMNVWNLNGLRRIKHKNFTWCRRVPFPIWSCLNRFRVDVNVQ
jgi:hypothetical protein